jgi:hypothetical protein
LPQRQPTEKIYESESRRSAHSSYPSAERLLLSLIFDSGRLADHHVVAVQPKPSFLPFFENRREEAAGTTGVERANETPEIEIWL